MLYDLQSTDDPRDIVHRSVQALVEGHVIGVPSETVYGLVASALCPAAVETLTAWLRAGQAHATVPINQNDATTSPGSMALSVRSCEAAGDFLLPRGVLSRRLCERCFPGPLTLIADSSHRESAISQLPETVRTAVADGEPGYAAFRVSGHRILSHIHRYLSAPLVWVEIPDAKGRPITTAAGLRSRLDEVGSAGAELQPPSLVLDDGATRYGGWGTIARVNGRTWSLYRDGVIQRAAMNQFVKPVIAIVCTGNTCRSPMAETLLRDLLQKRFGREDVARVVSAGVAAGRGSGASPQAVEVMGQLGLDLTGHSSQPLDDSLVSMADLVLTMTRRHRDAILAAWPNRSDRVFTLRRDGGDITDPVGMPVDVYQQCATQMRDELDVWLEKLGQDFFPLEVHDEADTSHNGDSHDPHPPGGSS